MNILDAVKLECQHTLDTFKVSASSDREGVISGAMTPGITSRMNSDNLAPLTIRQCRTRLKKLERDGILISLPTRGGLTRWWPVGFAAEATNPNPTE